MQSGGYLPNFILEFNHFQRKWIPNYVSISYIEADAIGHAKSLAALLCADMSADPQYSK